MGRGREVLAELFDFDDCEGAESAVTEISSSNGFDYDGESNTVHIPPGSTISKKNRGGGVESNGRRRLATVGQKTVLVVRAEFFDASTGSTIATLGDEVFGTNGDVINLKSQYDACSYGQLTFSPVADGTTFSNGVDSSANSLNGVITVSNPSFNVIGQGDGVVREEMRRLVGGRKGNDINNQYHMLCIPPGTTGGWIGYAYINYWLSVYNDNWCNYPSIQMHEIGHNIGLGHAGETATYDDQSGMMGYSYSSDEGPVMCFNAAKTFQLGWFNNNYVIQQSDSEAFNLEYPMIGFAQREVASAGDIMILRLMSTTLSKDFYVHFNAQIGFNSGTREAGNQVMVAERPPGVGYAASTLRSKLSAGLSYTIVGFGAQGDLIITVDSINTSSTPRVAFVRFEYGSPAPPTFQPTFAPTPLPTPTPTNPPTDPPTAAPT
eukprot:CAMPEP_0178920280 /NCGR_PEP_ID=MMETSP0786-20121207/14918_1 /TAXON_ID=186022 /ORGANISM="Thalassionema frauenfeldii, Strain CCMP 1798" /LENGTH=434 /DNA_ID=CAMNT_0020594331 /DNA_START=252 /DNA_END=1552 /DNA_ORIENTATION=+